MKCDRQPWQQAMVEVVLAIQIQQGGLAIVGSPSFLPCPSSH